MSNLSQTTGYAIEALVCLASCGNQTMRVGEIAELAHIPAAYLCKIFQRLSEAGIVESKRGYKGGVRLCRQPAKISLLEIEEAVECARSAQSTDGGEESTRPNTFWQAFHKAYYEKLAAMSLAEVIAYEKEQSAFSL